MMTGTWKLALTLGIALAASACATHKIQYKNPSVAAAGPSKTAKQSFFLWGLVGGKEVDLAGMCPGGIAQIESKSSAGDQILHWFTAGLYSPMSVDVQCASASTTAGGAL